MRGVLGRDRAGAAGGAAWRRGGDSRKRVLVGSASGLGDRDGVSQRGGPGVGQPAALYLRES